MEIKKAIEVLEDLSSYVEENWIEEEYEKDVQEVQEAVKLAVHP